MKRAALVVAALMVLGATAHAGLFEYVARDDGAFSWKLKGTETLPNGRVYELELTSQVWQGITWKHQLIVYEPRKVEFNDVMGLHITGGGEGKSDRQLGLMVANLLGGRFAILYHIPNQPLFGNLKEDALIAYTFLKYLETGDESWPLLFPMVKAAVRAMDALEQFAKQQWGIKLRGFLVNGASKRGWTTYLTGAVDPVRCIAIAPMVLDILNMAVSADHQFEFWGVPSEQIEDYTRANLQQWLDRGRGFHLFWMVDPYSYRYRLTMPKLIILGSNDQYWPVDAVNCYWRGLSYPKLLLIDPNSGHRLEDIQRVVSSVVAFYRAVASGKKLPYVNWKWEPVEGGFRLTVISDKQPIEARMWVARSKVRDFRKSKWVEQPMKRQGNACVGVVKYPEEGFLAAYGEIVLEVAGRKLYCSTQPRVLGRPSAITTVK